MMGKIEKIADQMWKVTLKLPLIGLDADKNEYWFFKGDLSRVLVKKAGTEEWYQYDDFEAI